MKQACESYVEDSAFFFTAIRLCVEFIPKVGTIKLTVSILWRDNTRNVQEFTSLNSTNLQPYCWPRDYIYFLYSSIYLILRLATLFLK
jgi:hypothetical protein